MHCCHNRSLQLTLFRPVTQHDKDGCPVLKSVGMYKEHVAVGPFGPYNKLDDVKYDEDEGIMNQLKHTLKDNTDGL